MTLVADADGPLSASAGDVADHVAPVHEVDIGPAGEAHDGQFHLAKESQHLRLQVARAGDKRPLGADLAPARPLHELPEHPRIDAVQNLVADAVYDVPLLRRARRCQQHGAEGQGL